MVVITDLPEFEKAAKLMYSANPALCRFSIKSRQAEQQLILKATDNSKTIIFKASDSQAVKKVEKLTRWMIDRMVSVQVGDALVD
jgi:hypothetical protein